MLINFILIINASTISNETFNYYYNLLTQISGENTFFEPMPVQLIGNIKCINNSRKVALGLFEASSVQTVTYIVQPPAKDNITLFTKINNLITNTGSGVTINVPPYFWVN